MILFELKLNLQNVFIPICVTKTLQNGVNYKQLYFVQLSVEKEENGGEENLLNGKERDLFLKKKKRKKLFLPSFLEGIASNGGECKTQDAKSSPVINSPVKAAEHPRPSGLGTCCWLAPGASFPLCVYVCVLLLPPPDFFHSGEMLPVGKH